jgi:replicative DNA helicase
VTAPLESMVPPNDCLAEQSTLGSMMIEKRAIWIATDTITASDFYRPAHKTIFNAIVRLHERNQPIDLITVQDELKAESKLDEVGGTAYLMALFDAVPTATNVKSHAQIVAENAGKRRLIDAGREAIGLAMSPDVSFADALSQSTDAFINIRGGNDKKMMHMREATRQAWDDIEEVIRTGVYMSDIRTGIDKLDDMTLGLWKGQYTLIGARPSNGKTAIAFQVVRHAPKLTGLMFCGESGPKALATRQLAAYSGVNMQLIRTGKLNGDHLSAITNAASRLDEVDLWMRFGSLSVSSIVATTKMAMLEHNISYIVVDYAQKVQAPGKDMKAKMDYLNVALKDLAEDNQIAVIVLVQLNRGAERGEYSDLESTRPVMKDFKEAGSFEETADIAIMLNNPKPPVDDGHPRKAEIILAKDRQGISGVIPVMWHGSRFTFEGIDQQHNDAPPESNRQYDGTGEY